MLQALDVLHRRFENRALVRADVANHLVVRIVVLGQQGAELFDAIVDVEATTALDWQMESKSRGFSDTLAAYIECFNQLKPDNSFESSLMMYLTCVSFMFHFMSLGRFPFFCRISLRFKPAKCASPKLQKPYNVESTRKRPDACYHFSRLAEQ